MPSVETHDYRCSDCGKRGHNWITCPGDPMERPIIFTAESVMAILAGAKTVTRRLVNLDTLRIRLPQRISSDLQHLPGMPKLDAKPGTYRATLNQHGAVCALVAGDRGVGQQLGVKPGEFDFVSPYAAGRTHLSDEWGSLARDGGHRRAWAIRPFGGQSLWVRETWRAVERSTDSVDGILFAADQAFVPIAPTTKAADLWIAAYDNGKHGENWRTPIYMPRWASRITLEVTSVRLERLQQITEQEAKVEGVRPFFERFENIGRDQRITSGELARDSEYRASYAVSWDEINADRGATWKSDPWVWAVTFARGSG